MVSHGIGKIHPNTAPSWFDEKFGRLNLTFRFLLNCDMLTHLLKRVLIQCTSEILYGSCTRSTLYPVHMISLLKWRQIA